MACWWGQRSSYYYTGTSPLELTDGLVLKMGQELWSSPHSSVPLPLYVALVTWLGNVSALSAGNSPVTTAVDIYSFGICALEVCSQFVYLCVEEEQTLEFWRHISPAGTFVLGGDNHPSSLWAKSIASNPVIFRSEQSNSLIEPGCSAIKPGLYLGVKIIWINLLLVTLNQSLHI